MRCIWSFLPALLLTATAPAGAGILEDISAGKLINPEVGVYAWYELKDNSTEGKIYLRQAIVGAEKVKRKDGFWVETEIIPQVGFPAIYKMLLTGPANDPGNIHQVIVKEGEGPASEMPLDPDAKAPETSAEQRTVVGKEKVATAQGEVEAEHVIIARDKTKVEVWLNDQIRPLGIVKMVTPDGELVLQRFGTGGPDGQSRLTPETAAAAPPKPEDRIQVRVEGGVKKNYSAGDAKAAEAKSGAQAPEKAAAKPAGKKSEKSGEKKK